MANKPEKSSQRADHTLHIFETDESSLADKEGTGEVSSTAQKSTGQFETPNTLGYPTTPIANKYATIGGANASAELRDFTRIYASGTPAAIATANTSRIFTPLLKVIDESSRAEDGKSSGEGEDATHLISTAETDKQLGQTVNNAYKAMLKDKSLIQNQETVPLKIDKSKPSSEPLNGSEGQHSLDNDDSKAADEDAGQQDADDDDQKDEEQEEPLSDEIRETRIRRIRMALKRSVLIRKYMHRRNQENGDESPDDNSTERLVHKQASQLKYMYALILVLSMLLVALVTSNIILARTQPKVGAIAVPVQQQIKLSDQSQEPFQSKRITYEDDPIVLAVMNDSALHPVFYGINYTPESTRYPQCGASLKNVTRDIAILAQLTSRIRMYGTECMQVDLVLQAIQDLDVPVTVSVGIWVDRFVDTTMRQLGDLRRVLSKYPSYLIDSVLVGNEALFREDVNESELIGYLEYVKEYLDRSGITGIAVGTAEIGIRWSNELSKHADVLAANVHPFFGGVPVGESTKWTYDYMMSDVMSKQAGGTQRHMISEVGWPSQGGQLGAAVAGMDELQHFMDTWLCPNQNRAIGWYWFEAFDQPWKAGSTDGAWEQYWGLFTANRQLKEGLVIPECGNDTVSF